MVAQELAQHNQDKPSVEFYDSEERSIADLKAKLEKRKREIPEEIKGKESEIERVNKEIASQKIGVAELNEKIKKFKEDVKQKTYMKYALQIGEIMKDAGDNKIERVKPIVLALKQDSELSKEDKILARLEVASKLSEFSASQREKRDKERDKERISQIYNSSIRELEKGAKALSVEESERQSSIWSKFFDKSIYLKVKEFVADAKEKMRSETESIKALSDVGASILKCDLKRFSKIKAKLEEGKIQKGGFVETLKSAVYNALSFFGIIKKANLTVEGGAELVTEGATKVDYRTKINAESNGLLKNLIDYFGNNQNKTIQADSPRR